MPMSDRDWSVDPLRDDPASAPTPPPAAGVPVIQTPHVAHDPRTWGDVRRHLTYVEAAILSVLIPLGVILSVLHGHTGTLGH